MKLHAKRIGSGHTQLIILHGLLGSSDNWHTLSKVFSVFSTVHALDLRNHGKSPHSPDHSYALMAEDVGEYLDGHGIVSAVVLGHSMGGKVAMQFALDQPARVQKLIVADIAPKSYPDKYSRYFSAMIAASPANAQKRTEVEALLKPDMPDQGFRQFIMKNLARDENGILSWQPNLNALIDNAPNLWAEIAADRPYAGPALFIAGANSSYITKRDRPAILRLFPGAIFSVIKDAGHWVHAEQQSTFAGVVQQFIKS